MPQMSSTAATIHATRDLIYAIQNTEPEIPLVKLGNAHKEALRSLAEIFGNATPPEVPQKVTIDEAYP